MREHSTQRASPDFDTGINQWCMMFGSNPANPHFFGNSVQDCISCQSDLFQPRLVLSSGKEEGGNSKPPTNVTPGFGSVEKHSRVVLNIQSTWVF